MVSRIDRSKKAFGKMVRSLEHDGVAARDINVALFSLAIDRWLAEVGEDKLRNVLQGTINQIEEGAYRDGYVTPEARMYDEEEAHRRRMALTVIEGGGGSKV
ncbi:hypothetical protein [Neorhizobium huautlense]|uniref:hypothetical protein n=1 Tax=Neorhizobium huautlense TaxID=67774 RepID=UPI000CF9F2A1|nr:hypothetical protein [Neorhizobium huautlense]